MSNFIVGLFTFIIYPIAPLISWMVDTSYRYVACSAVGGVVAVWIGASWSPGSIWLGLGMAAFAVGLCWAMINTSRHYTGFFAALLFSGPLLGWGVVMAIAGALA